MPPIWTPSSRRAARRSEPGSLVGAERFESGAGPVALGKAPLISGQSWAEQVVRGMETICFHFCHGLLRCPPLIRHAKSGNHHAHAVISQAAMDEDFFTGIFAQQLQKPRKDFVPRKRAVPMNRKVFHAQRGDLVVLVVPPAPNIDHKVDSHAGQIFEACWRRLAPAKKAWRYLLEIWHTLQRPLESH